MEINEVKGGSRTATLARDLTAYVTGSVTIIFSRTYCFNSGGDVESMIVS